MRLSKFFRSEINPQYADVLLFTCCLTSGLVDSTIYNAYTTFVSMQTGNTIFVGLGASNQNARPYGWARSLTSIVCFIIGSFLFARLDRVLGPRCRGSLMLSFFIQAIIIILTAGLIEGGVVSSTSQINGSSVPIQWNQEIPIVLLSLQSAGQIVASRALGYNEIPTVVITSLLCDLMSDPQLFVWENKKRNRRITAFAVTLLGAIAGGWVTKASRQLTPTLWVSAGIKMAVAFAWGFWQEK